MSPSLSEHYINRQPSAIRKAQILFESRTDKREVEVVNLAIGNISLPMHSKMLNRLNQLGENGSPFSNGVVRYSSSEGTEECKKAIINSIAAEIPNQNIYDLDCVITDGGSQAMELMLLGVCGTLSKHPLLVVDPLYTNYVEFANRLSIPISSILRTRNKTGSYNKLDLNQIRNKIDKENPNGILIIPADNPTGYQMSQDTIIEIAKMCVEKNIWLISDEAYRNIYYTNNGPTSIWDISNKTIPGIKGRRISIESVSKVWNACGLRIGALVTDSQVMFDKVRSEYTANLCANVIGQYIFGSIANLSPQEITDWYKMQRKHYSEIITDLVNGLEKELPGLIISKPKASIYIVLDFSRITPDDFNISRFIEYTAKYGISSFNNKNYTLLLSPMNGFFSTKMSHNKLARIALVEPKDKMKAVPSLLSSLLNDYILSSKG